MKRGVVLARSRPRTQGTCIIFFTKGATPARTFDRAFFRPAIPFLRAGCVMSQQFTRADSNSLLENSRRLRKAFAEVKRAYPEPYEDDRDTAPRRSWQLVDASSVSKSKTHLGLLVLRENRGGVPYFHWSCTVARSELEREMRPARAGE